MAALEAPAAMVRQLYSLVAFLGHSCGAGSVLGRALQGSMWTEEIEGCESYCFRLSSASLLKIDLLKIDRHGSFIEVDPSSMTLVREPNTCVSDCSLVEGF